jgi:hypothetical protein
VYADNVKPSQLFFFFSFVSRQVDAWLHMEADFGRVSREVARLQAAVDGREADRARVAQLAKALEEQRNAARKAKEALKAVRQVAAGAAIDRKHSTQNEGGSASVIDNEHKAADS